MNIDPISIIKKFREMLHSPEELSKAIKYREIFKKLNKEDHDKLETVEGMDDYLELVGTDGFDLNNNTDGRIATNLLLIGFTANEVAEMSIPDQIKYEVIIHDIRANLVIDLYKKHADADIMSEEIALQLKKEQAALYTLTNPIFKKCVSAAKDDVRYSDLESFEENEIEKLALILEDLKKIDPQVQSLTKTSLDEMRYRFKTWKEAFDENIELLKLHRLLDRSEDMYAPASASDIKQLASQISAGVHSFLNDEINKTPYLSLLLTDFKTALQSAASFKEFQDNINNGINNGSLSPAYVIEALTQLMPDATDNSAPDVRYQLALMNMHCFKEIVDKGGADEQIPILMQNVGPFFENKSLFDLTAIIEKIDSMITMIQPDDQEEDESLIIERDAIVQSLANLMAVVAHTKNTHQLLAKLKAAWRPVVEGESDIFRENQEFVVQRLDTIRNVLNELLSSKLLNDGPLKKMAEYVFEGDHKKQNFLIGLTEVFKTALLTPNTFTYAEDISLSEFLDKDIKKRYREVSGLLEEKRGSKYPVWCQDQELLTKIANYVVDGGEDNKSKYLKQLTAVFETALQAPGSFGDAQKIVNSGLLGLDIQQRFQAMERVYGKGLKSNSDPDGLKLIIHFIVNGNETQDQFLVKYKIQQAYKNVGTIHTLAGLIPKEGIFRDRYNALSKAQDDINFVKLFWNSKNSSFRMKVANYVIDGDESWKKDLDSSAKSVDTVKEAPVVSKTPEEIMPAIRSAMNMILVNVARVFGKNSNEYRRLASIRDECNRPFNSEKVPSALQTRSVSEDKRNLGKRDSTKIVANPYVLEWLDGVQSATARNSPEAIMGFVNEFLVNAGQFKQDFVMALQGCDQALAAQIPGSKAALNHSILMKNGDVLSLGEITQLKAVLNKGDSKPGKIEDLKIETPTFWSPEIKKKNPDGFPVEVITCVNGGILVKVGPCDLSGVGGHDIREKMIESIVNEVLRTRNLKYEDVHVSASVAVRGFWQRINHAFSIFEKSKNSDMESAGSSMNAYIKTAGEKRLTCWEPRKGPGGFFNKFSDLVISVVTHLFENKVKNIKEDEAYTSERATNDIFKDPILKPTFNKVFQEPLDKVQALVALVTKIKTKSPAGSSDDVSAKETAATNFSGPEPAKAEGPPAFTKMKKAYKNMLPEKPDEDDLDIVSPRY